MIEQNTGQVVFAFVEQLAGVTQCMPLFRFPDESRSSWEFRNRAVGISYTVRWGWVRSRAGARETSLSLSSSSSGVPRQEPGASCPMREGSTEVTGSSAHLDVESRQ